MGLWRDFEDDIVKLAEDDYLQFIICISLAAALLLYPKYCCAWLCHLCKPPGKVRKMSEGDGESSFNFAGSPTMSNFRVSVWIALEAKVIDRARLLLGWACFYLAARCLTFGGSGFRFFGRPFKITVHRICEVPLCWSLVGLALSVVDYGVLRLKRFFHEIEGEDDQTNIDFSDVLRDFGKGVVYFMFLVFLLGFFSENLNGLMNSLALGCTGLVAAISFKLIQDVYGLIMIIFDKPFRLFDHISIGGIEGFVTKVGLRCFIIKGFDGSYTYVPNGHVVSTPVRNFYTCAQKQQVIEFTLSYGTENAAVFGTLRNSLLNYFQAQQLGGGQPLGSWLDIKLDLKPLAVFYRVTYFYPKGEDLARSEDPNWNFYHEAMDFRADVIAHICDEVNRRNLGFATFPMVVET